MRYIKTPLLIIMMFHFISLVSQPKTSNEEVKKAMLKATRYMVETVSTNGGYVWYYMPDFSRRWGEMEAYKTMIWVQSPGTISIGHLFLDAYRVTRNEYYFEAAQKAAAAIIWGQSNEGGWNYIVDFAGDRSLKHWYNTIGKNGWRLEEFQHYYGNSTFDDDVTANATRFLLRIYLEKMDPVYKPSLEKAIGFILKSQYPNGGWPQRYPLKYDFEKEGKPDYTSFYTFNDDVIWENIELLIECYLVLGEKRFLDPIYRGMDFYRISQDESGAWGQQLNMEMQASGARTYEPKALLPGATFENAKLLLKFFQFTGDTKYLAGIPKAISWLEVVALPSDQIDQIEGNNTHPTFVEIGTNKPLYVHRKGSNVKYGKYYVDHDDRNLLAHYGGKRRIRLHELKEKYQEILKLSPEEATKDSPLKPAEFTHSGQPQKYYDLYESNVSNQVETSKVVEVLNGLDDQGRWLTTRAYVSNPYIGEGKNKELTDEYATTRVGDETDTSPYPNTTDQEYISTSEYITNMRLLLGYIQTDKSQK